MSSGNTILNFYLEKYGVIESKTATKSLQHDDKAKKRWENLRQNVRNVSELVSTADFKSSTLKHGIKFIRRVYFENKIEQSDILKSDDENFLVLDGNCLKFIDDNGRIKDTIPYNQLPVKFDRLLYAEGSKRIIAWSCGCYQLNMLDNQFQLIDSIDQSLYEQPIHNIIYNRDLEQLISTHLNSITIWRFRYANKKLLPYYIINFDNLKETNELFLPTLLALERTKSKYQKLYIVNNCNIISINLSRGIILKEYEKMHDRPITAMIFFNPMKLLITGSEDGSIKVWNEINEESELILKMVFVGHNIGSVNYLALFPGGCQATVISSGQDCLLRVWNLELCDEVENVELDYSAESIQSDIGKCTFMTVSDNFIDIWYHEQVYNDLLTLPVPICNAELIADNPKLLLHYSKYGLIYLSDSQNPDHVYQKTVLDRMNGLMRMDIIACFYDDYYHYLYVLLEENQVQIYDTTTDPMLPHNIITIATSESVNLINMVGYVGKIVTGGKNSQTKWRSMLFYGASNGDLLIMEPIKDDPDQLNFITTFSNTQTIELAHDGAICSMLINKSMGNLYTASRVDKTVVVWRIYPFAAEPLSKVLTFYCGLYPSMMANIQQYLLTAFEDEESAYFPVVVYDVEKNDRFDHSPTEDHQNPIVSVSSSEKMNIFLSASSYGLGVIKIWTRRNILLREINLNLPINTAIFCTEKADILLSLSTQICIIDHHKFLPKVYLKKQILMHFNDDLTNDNKEIKIKKLDKLEIDNNFNYKQQNMMNNIKTIYRYQNYVDKLSDLEFNEIKTKEDILNENRKYHLALNEDINNIKNGKHIINKDSIKKYYIKPNSDQIFQSYANQILKFKDIVLPKIDSKPFDDENDKIKLIKTSPPKYVEPSIEGFFPGPKLAERLLIGDQINPSGYIPNSTIIKLLWPEKVIKDISKPKPELTSFDILQRELAKKLSELEEEEGQTMHFEWESDEEVKLDIFDDKPKPITPPPIEVNKFQKALQEPIPEIPKLEKEPSLPIETQKSDHTILSTLSTESLKLEKESKSLELKRVRFKESTKVKEEEDDDLIPEFKFVKEPSLEIKEPKPIIPEVKETPPKEIETLLPMKREETFFMTEIEHNPPSPLIILPNFLTSFIDDSWFHRICPPPYNDSTCLKFLPQPLTEETFLQFLLKHIKNSSNYIDISGMVDAIYLLYSRDLISKQQLNIIASNLEQKINEIELLDSEEILRFFKTSLKFIASLEKIISDKGLVIICLSRYFDADVDLRGFMKSILCHIGLDDTEYNILEKELDNFKLYSIKTGLQRNKELSKLVTDWLQKWYQSMLTYAEECRLKLLADITKIEQNNNTPNLSKSTMNIMDNLRRIFHLDVHSSYDLVCLFPSDKTNRSVLNYINTLNYFIYKQSRKKQRSFINKTSENDSVKLGPKKTIISLPKLDPNKQCLVRLGESNADILESKKRTDFDVTNAMWMKNVIVDPTVHPTHQPYNHYQLSVGGGFVPYLNLPLKRALVNPFPRDEDELEWNTVNHTDSMFNSRHKLFIQQFSLPPEPF